MELNTVDSYVQAFNSLTKDEQVTLMQRLGLVDIADQQLRAIHHVQLGENDPNPTETLEEIKQAILTSRGGLPTFDNCASLKYQPEQVLRDTISEANENFFKRSGVEVIDRKDALIEIQINSRVRQVGKTGITKAIAHILASLGFTNVECHSESDGMFNSEHFKQVVARYGDVRIKVLDTNLESIRNGVTQPRIVHHVKLDENDLNPAKTIEEVMNKSWLDDAGYELQIKSGELPHHPV